MKKRFILCFLSLIVLFGINLDVNAATEITVDTSKCLESDPGSCLVTNQSYVGLTFPEDYTLFTGTMCTVKTIESYYNKNSNIITYKFTETFSEFLASTKNTDNDYSNLTVEEYAKITGATKEEMELGSTQLVNDLDKIYSLFLVYIRKRNIISPSSAKCRDGDLAKRMSETVGSYLVLHNGGADELVYAPMVANLQFKANDLGEWELNPVEIVPKSTKAGLVNLYINDIENSLGTENFNNISSRVGEIIKLYAVLNMPKYPTNSINRTYWSSYTLPNGMDYTRGFSSFNFEAVGQNFSNQGNGQIVDSDTGEVVANLVLEGKKLTVQYFLDNILVDTITQVVEAKLNTNAVIGAAGNVINAHAEYADDPYSEDDIEVLDTANMINIYTYGLKLNLTDKDDITKFLPGAVFELYDATDTEFKNVLTTITIGEDGKASIAGIAAGNYILKQVKAATGYHLNDNYAFSFISTDIDEEGYFTVDLTSQKYSLLPFTGGAGTLTYTLWGLLIIGVSAISVVLYKKRQQINL